LVLIPLNQRAVVSVSSQSLQPQEFFAAYIRSSVESLITKQSWLSVFGKHFERHQLTEKLDKGVLYMKCVPGMLNL